MRRLLKTQRTACRCSHKPVSGCSLTAQSHLLPTIATCSANSQKCRACLLQQVSTQSAFSLRVEQAKCLPTGLLMVVHQWICGMSMCVALCRFNATEITSTTALSNRLVCCTQCTGHSVNQKPRAVCVARHCMIALPQKAHVLVKSLVGSAQTGLRLQAKKPNTNTRMAVKTGLNTPRQSAKPHAKQLPCLTNRHSASSFSRAPMPSRLLIMFRQTTCRCQLANLSTRSVSTSVVALKPTSLLHAKQPIVIW